MVFVTIGSHPIRRFPGKFGFAFLQPEWITRHGVEVGLGQLFFRSIGVQPFEYGDEFSADFVRNSGSPAAESAAEFV